MAGAFQPNAFQPNAFQVDTGGTEFGSFTADAVLFKTTTEAVTADAAISTQPEATFTANAWFSPVGSFTADSIVLSTFSFTRTANSIISGTIEGSLTADALIVDYSTFKADALIVNPYHAAIVALSPLVYFKLDDPIGTEGATDYSGNERHATGSTNVTFESTDLEVAGGPTADFPATAGTAISGFASGYTWPFASNTLTIMAWVESDVTPSSSNRDSIWGAGDSSAKPQLEIGGNSGSGNVSVVIAGTFMAQTSEGGLVTANTRRFVVYTRSGTGAGTHQFYIDGEPRTTTQQSGTNYTSGAFSARIGNRFSNQYWDGNIGHVAVFDYALSAEQISRLYQLASGGEFTADAEIQAGNPFTADSVLKATVESTFTADAEIADATVESTFTANSIIVVPLVIDDFNRTTSANEIGQPSHAGRYHETFFYSPTEFQGYVNGATWETNIPLGISGAYLSPFTPDFTAAFEFRIPDNDQFAGYQVHGLTVPHESNGSLLRKAVLEIFEEGGGVWHLYAGGSTSVTFSPTVGDWWHFKGYVDLTGGTSGAKVWKVGDPEPAAWQITRTRANWFSYALSTSSRACGQVWLYSGDTEKAEIDNLSVQALNASGIREIFTADAVIGQASFEGSFSADATLASDTGTYQFGFTADADLVREAVLGYFSANAYLVKTTPISFTANARLVTGVSATFTANAWIRGTESRNFAAKAWLVKPSIPTPTPTTYHKRVTFHVQMRRPTALSAFIPPRETESEREQVPGGSGIGDPDCLPPCPSYSAGAIGGANGTAVRTSVVYCSECSVYFYTSSNKLGRGPTGTSDPHPGCGTTHNRNQHILKMFVDYNEVPTVDVGMIAKMVWAGSAPNTVAVRVYANVTSMPPMIEEGDFANDLNIWTGGDYMGTMSFGATGSVTTSDGLVKFCHIPSSMTIRKSTLSNAIFRFELADVSQYYGAEFRAPNAPLNAEDF